MGPRRCSRFAWLADRVTEPRLHVHERRSWSSLVAAFWKVGARVTPEERATARARCEAATGGDWQHRLSHVEHHLSTEYQRGVVFSPGHHLVLAETATLADAEFIAHARTDLEAALAMLDAIEAEIVTWTGFSTHERNKIRAILEGDRG